jgi:citrate lyase subunit beta/citryl-CoA lyase
MTRPTSPLFVPAHEEQKVGKAISANADAVILDLEDGVPESSKERAREIAVRTLRHLAPGGPEVWVRVNSIQTIHFLADLAAIPWSGVSGVVLAKAEETEAVRIVAAAGARDVLLLLESVAGFDALAAQVRAGPVKRVAIGTWDLALDLGLNGVDDPDDYDVLWHLRCRLVVESRRLGLEPPIDGVYTSLQDDQGFAWACERARRAGYAGKLLIHPRQILLARSVFADSRDDIEYAREIVTAYEEALRAGRGVTRVRGRMVDLPMVERAKALLDRAEIPAT